MTIKRTTLSTVLSDLYGDKYESHIKIGQEYWYNFDARSNVGKKHGPGWHKIKITYLRSKCVFFIFPYYEDMEEEFCPIDCYLVTHLVLARINPLEDLNGIIDNIELTKLTTRFNDSITIVENWDNREVIEINSEEFSKLSNATQKYIKIYFQQDKPTISIESREATGKLKECIEKIKADN